MSLVFYIARHGETEWNVTGHIQGHVDIPLNANGLSQALNLAAHLKHLHFTSCYSSDLKRAFETAKVILDERMPKIELFFDKRLRERNFRNWEGKLFEDFNRANPEDKLTTETNEQIIERVKTCLEEIAIKEKNGVILILTHGGVISNLLVHLLNINLKKIKIFVKNGGYFKLVFSESTWIIEEMHNIETLEKSLI